MPIPRIAIVGRPNVGKSSLMNMLARSKVSIVDPTPGVTRDRVSAIVHLDPPDNSGKPRIIEVVDTGGFGAYVADGERFDDVGADLSTLAGDIEFQIAQAAGNSDLILFVLDAQAGVTALDEEIARKLREKTLGKSRANRTGDVPRGAGPLIQVVANKTDSQMWEPHAMEIAGLGFGEPWIISAKNNYMRREFADQLYAKIGEISRDAVRHGRDAGHAVDPKDAIPELKLAIIGKRNAGKSTLVNTLAGEPRMIVSEIAGTTRDSVDVRFEFDGKALVAIDTAGLRRRRSFANQIEWYAYDRLQLSVERADVVMVLIDATVKISQVDEQVAMLAQKAYKPTIIVVNKWDLVEGRRARDGKPITTGNYEEYLRRELRGLWYAPIAFMSGQTGMNVRATVELAFDLFRQTSERVTTGKLNRLISRILETSGPSDKLGSQAKVYFVAQTSTNPPTISMVVNKIELFTPNYQRFLLNRFREELPFTEVPIKLNVRPRSSKPKPGESAIAAAGVRMKPTAERDDAREITADEYFDEFEPEIASPGGDRGESPNVPPGQSAAAEVAEEDTQDVADAAAGEGPGDSDDAAMDLVGDEFAAGDPEGRIPLDEDDDDEDDDEPFVASDDDESEVDPEREPSRDAKPADDRPAVNRSDKKKPTTEDTDDGFIDDMMADDPSDHAEHADKDRRPADRRNAARDSRASNAGDRPKKRTPSSRSAPRPQRSASKTGASSRKSPATSSGTSGGSRRGAARSGGPAASIKPSRSGPDRSARSNASSAAKKSPSGKSGAKNASARNAPAKTSPAKNVSKPSGPRGGSARPSAPARPSTQRQSGKPSPAKRSPDQKSSRSGSPAKGSPSRGASTKKNPKRR